MMITPILKIIINKDEERKYLKYIYDNYDKTIDYNKFTKRQNIDSIKKDINKISKKFFVFVENYCKLQWKHRRYYVILSEITNCSFASPLKEHENKVLLDIRNKKTANRIICHELLHQYFAQIYNFEKKYEDIVHELFVAHMLFDTELKEIFNDSLTIKKNLLCAGHRDAYNLYAVSKKIWNSKRDIRDYVENVISKIKTSKIR